MRYVIDTSVEIKTVVQEADSGKAVRLRDGYRKGVHTLLTPDLFPIEVCNALMILERAGRLQTGEADLVFDNFLLELPTLYTSIPLLPRALDIAKQFRQSVYDCLYVATAEREGCELVTADEKLIRAVQPSFPFVISLAKLP